ncbi:MAG: hypothetical protein JNN30_06135 [Rhodanobacteraceae bacterium]|nr:hypothetical protein [Rhodanobacteraceae bacterium]
MTESASVEIGPENTHCRYWAKVVRAGTPLPLPSKVFRADDLPGPYLPIGDEELFAGDVLFAGEELHPRRSYGWSYSAFVAGISGCPIELEYNSAVKARLKELGLDKRLLAGSGQLAGLVRVAHALRAGLCPYTSELQHELGAVALNLILPVAKPAHRERL